tara:strand:+ start:114466 stop:115254 length:789 start_codon:yes stop_codon:yes gene_type:complete
MENNETLEEKFFDIVNEYNKEIKLKDPDIKKLLFFGIGIVEIINDYEGISKNLKEVNDIIINMKKDGLNIDVSDVHQNICEYNYNHIKKVSLNVKKSFIELLNDIFSNHYNSKNIDTVERFKLDIDTKRIFVELESIDNDKLKNYYKTVCERIDMLVYTYKSISTKTTPPPDPKTPFTDPKTHELFNYIVDNWDYEKGQKWADIWNIINVLEGYKAPFKNEYRKYVIQRFGYTGQFQFDKVKRDENRDKQILLELIKEFSKK